MSGGLITDDTMAIDRQESKRLLGEHPRPHRGHRSRRLTAAPLAVLLAVACAPFHRVSGQANGPVRPGVGVPGASGGVTAFVDVGVIPMDSERVLERQTVLVEGGRIRALGPTATVRVPADAHRIDGRGKFLVPGLADMHAHLGTLRPDVDSVAETREIERELYLLLANGVTLIRNVDYFSAPDSQSGPRYGIIRDVRARAAAGVLPSPTIYTSAKWRMLAESISVVQNLAAYKAAGYDFIKVHGEGGPLLDSMVTAARQVGLQLMGHIGADSARIAITDSFTSIEHLTGYPGGGISPDTSVLADTVAIPELVALTRRAGVWNTPTQAIYEWTDTNPSRRPEMRYDRVHFAPSPYWSSDTATRPTVTPELMTWLHLRRRLIKALQDAGAGLLTGTDMPLLAPGFGVHRELQALVTAGLTPYQALVASTRNPAAFFGVLDDRGTVSVGKRADLVLLSANPLQDIRRTSEPAGVMVGGRWLPSDTLKQKLEAYADPH